MQSAKWTLAARIMGAIGILVALWELARMNHIHVL